VDIVLYVWPGALLFCCGFVALFGLLASEGALATRRQFGALANVAAGRAGTTKRVVLGCGALAIVCGACGSFTGVAARDGERARRCEQTCTERGYTDATIRGSTEMENEGRHAFVACACTGGPAPDPLELDAEALME
jgi:hypothetical protein